MNGPGDLSDGAVWSRKMQWWGIFIKDIGLPGTFAMGLLYVLLFQAPAAMNASMELKVAVVNVASLMTQQSIAIAELTHQMVDHRLKEERREK